MERQKSDYMQNARPLRILYGFSQCDVAARVNVSQPLYCKAENGQVRPSLNLIESVCELYEVTLVDFLVKDKKSLLDQVITSEHFRRNRLG